jgi:hypothetical protein
MKENRNQEMERRRRRAQELREKNRQSKGKR